MSCNQCIKLNPVPSCANSDEFLLSGISFPDYPNSEVKVIYSDQATDRTTYITINTDGSGQIVEGGIDIALLMPLMNHWFEVGFFIDGVPANFVLTNPDATTEIGCCIEFTTFDGLTASDGWDLTSQECAV